jgi:YidC/Oxa1 family membrane protein insertase
MKLQSSILLLSIGTAGAFFVPSTSTSCARSRQQQPTALSFGVDPSAFHDIPNHMQSLQDVFSTFSLADAMDAVPDAAAGAVEEAAKNDNGGFGFLTGPIKGLLQVIHSGIVATGTKENAWGVAIILLTILIKIGTFPLTKAQLESTNKMQVGIHTRSC